MWHFEMKVPLLWLCMCKIYQSFWNWIIFRVLSTPVKYCTDRSKAVLLLRIFFLSCVCYAFVRVCLYVPCGHLLGKGWPLGSRLWCLTVSLSLSHWYPGSGVVFDCIDSWYLHTYFELFYGITILNQRCLLSKQAQKMCRCPLII